MPLSCIIYDLDGTLIDSAADIAIAANRLRHHFCLPPLEEADIRDFMGDGAVKLVERALFGLVDDPVMRPEKRLPKSAADLNECVEHFRDIYGADPVMETTVAPGALDILSRWQAEGTAQVCLTNKPHKITVDVLERLDLLRFFDLVCGPGALDDDGEVLPAKPDLRLLDYIFEQTGAEASETVLVGDGEPDFALAKAGGIRCVGLLNGYTAPDVVLQRMEDLELAATSLLHAGEILEGINQSL